MTIIDVFGRIGFRGYTKNDLVSEGAITLSPSNIVNNKMDYSSCSHISWDKYYESPEIMIHNGDILLVKTGSSYGKVALVTDLPEKATINPQYVVLKQSKINASFLCYILQSTYSQNVFNEFVVGTAIPTFSQANLNSMLLMIPPMVEQKRIAYILETTIGLVEILESEKNDILFAINNAKSKILDLAIQGKLVPQDPSDEPASVLIERICAAKEELIKQGKIKQDKKESVIFKGEDNSYYDIDVPECWEVISLASITKSISDGSHNPPPDSFCGIPILSAANIFSNVVQLNSASRWVTEDDWVAENKRTNIEMGDVLLTIVGSIGRAAVVNADARFALQRSVAAIKPMLMCSKYLMYFFESPVINHFFEHNSKGTAQKGIYLNSLRELKILVPPLAEQKRIVVAIEKYYRELDRIAEMLA